MRILIVSEDLPAPILAGAGLHVILLANTLIEAGHHVEIVGRKRVRGAENNHGFLGRLHTTIDFAHTGWKEAASGVFNPLRRRHVAARVKSAVLDVTGPWDVIHYHGHHPEVGAVMPVDLNFVQTLHDQGSECMTKARFRNGEPCTARAPEVCAGCATPFPNLVQTQISKNAVLAHRAAAREAYTRHQGVFVSEFLERRCKEILQALKPLNTHVVHNFIDYQKLSVCARGFVQNSNTGTARPRVFMAGRIDETKGFRALFRALKPEAFRSLQIRVAGEGSDAISLREEFGNRGIEFLGWQTYEVVIRETLNASVAVVPSVWEEPCSTSVLEALALGRVVMALERGGTPELVKYAAAPGQLRLYKSSIELAEALEQLALPISEWPVQDLADVRRRLPELLAVYRNADSM